MGTPVPFLQLFRYASGEDLILLAIANVFILYSSLNIPLVNIIYGLMMREMNDFVARRAQLKVNDNLDSSPISSQFVMMNDTSQGASSHNGLTSYAIHDNYSESSFISETSTTAPYADASSFNGTYDDAKELFINNSYRLCVFVILFGITRFIALYFALLFFSRAAANQAKRVKILFFKSLLRQEVAWFECNRTGDFAIRITSDLSKFEDGIGEKIALCLNALFAWVSSLVSSFYYGWELTLVCLVLVPLTVIITTIIAEFQATYSMKENSALSRAFNVCHEVISSIRTVLAFQGEDKEADRFKKGLDSAYKYGLKRNIFAALNLGFTWMSGYLGFAICLLYSTKFYKPENYGQYDEAHIITILWSAAGCVFLLNRMMPFIEIIQIARGSASNLFAVIEREPMIDVTSNEGLKPLHFEANVKFDNVCFCYPNGQVTQQVPEQQSQPQREQELLKNREGRMCPSSVDENESESLLHETDDEVNDRSDGSSDKPTEKGELASKLSDTSGQSRASAERYTLRNMSMEVRSGQTVALVGPSGSGKSTALSLLQRFYELDEGSITLGGYDIRELNLAWLRSQCGVVTQEPVLFDMSIADNIRLGARPGQFVSMNDIEQAARSANAHSFITRLPSGYETRAGARGVQLSGGQKQRIAIARALIRQPKLLLLDEATSALDLESESIVQRALEAARIGRTTFIVAHRLSTIRNADKIVVLDKGSIVEIGSHEELLARRGLYHQINQQQRQGGVDLGPGARRNSQIGCPAALALGNTLQVAGGVAGGGPAAGGLNYTRESRSLSLYSTTGKYTAGGFGAAGHGGNGEGVDNGGSCAPELQANAFATDDDLYNRNEDQEESDTSNCVGGGPARLLPVDAETQASLLEFGDSAAPGVITSGKRQGAAGSRAISPLAVLRFVAPDPAYSLVGVLSSLLMGLCIPVSALIIGDIATIFSTDKRDEIRQGLASHGLLYTGLALFAFAVSFVQVVSFGLAGEKIGITLRLRCFRALMKKRLFWFDHKQNSPGAICARLASDVGNVQSITGNRTAVIFQSISILISTFVFAIYFNLKFSSICALFVATLLISTVLQARYAAQMAITNRCFDSQMGKIVLEASANIKTVMSLHQEAYFVEKCEQLLERDKRSSSLDNHMRLSLESLKYAMTAISKGSSFYFAAQMLLNDEITIDVIFKLIEIILYGLTEASKSLIFISDLEKARKGTQNLYKLINGSSPGAGTSGSALDELTMTAGGEEADEKCRGNISFDNVSFHYPSRPDACILRGLSLDIPAGKSVALVGRSGCGKSTIVQLLEKFYDYPQGSILFDGRQLSGLPSEWVRRQIALVSQEPSLLSYTIKENIQYGDNSRFVPHDEVVRAAQVANIHEFIMGLPDNYETQLNESNSLQLSGGQKQRIAIARALIRQAPIMLFDEATSALDTKSELVVQEALDRARQGKTSVIIAHRLSTIKNADRIAVLKDGVVVEQGSHEELLERRGDYYCLYKNQPKV